MDVVLRLCTEISVTQGMAQEDLVVLLCLLRVVVWCLADQKMLLTR